MKTFVIALLLVVIIAGVVASPTTEAQSGLSEAHAVKVRKSANQTLPNNTPTAITWDVEVYDTDGFMSLPTSIIQIPTNLPKGIYAFDLVLEFAKTGTVNTPILVEIYNDDFVNQEYIFTLRDNRYTWGTSFGMRNDTGQTIEVKVTAKGTGVSIVGQGIVRHSLIDLTWIGTIE